MVLLKALPKWMCAAIVVRDLRGQDVPKQGCLTFGC